MFNDNKVIIIIINKSGILYPFVYKAAKTAGFMFKRFLDPVGS
jgi:hypothetical protein